VWLRSDKAGRVRFEVQESLGGDRMPGPDAAARPAPGCVPSNALIPHFFS